ncbi:maltose permease MAL31 [Xylariales sp. PMI_506]|nr:maltose permease MAL31 [Xylariales sp. PMI_506]
MAPSLEKQPAELPVALEEVTSIDSTRAKAFEDTEHALTIREAIVAYKPAVFWSLAVSLCVIMEGYDSNLIGNFFAYPTFAAKYGQYVDSSGNHQLTAPWQAALNDMAGVGGFIGVLINGPLVSRFGQKRVILAGLIALSAFIFITFFAPSIGVLAAGEFLCGIPWGIFASSAPAYASEVLPMRLRVYLTSYTNMCFIIGQLIASGVLAGLVSRTDEWSYRIPFALQWMWPVILFPILCFAPESPWHLVRQGRLKEAEASLRRLQSSGSSVSIEDRLASMVHTNEFEARMTKGTSYLDCFRGVERRRTEIACMSFAGQTLVGLAFAYNSTYFFEQIGLTTDQTYKLNVGGTALALVGTLVCWVALMPYLGRRTMYIAGSFFLFIIQFLIGILNVRTDKESIAMGQAVLTLVWTFVFQLSLGQLGWALPAEVSSTRLRQQTVCLARDAYYIVNIIAQVLEPYFMNSSEWNVKGYVGFFWGGLAFVTFVWAWFRLPETKDRTYEELDWLFAEKIPAKDFAKTQVKLFDHDDRSDV